jgi:protein-tyrosine-phosphatase
MVQYDGCDSLLETRRRRRALDRLEVEPPARVLFVCFGNVCRSPYAERVLLGKALPGVSVDSVGFVKPGRPPPDVAQKVALGRGITHGDHRSRVVKPADLESADLIFFFDRYNRAELHRWGGRHKDRFLWLGDLDPEWEGRRAILDPWGKPEAEFERVFSRIERCVDAMAGVLGGRPRHSPGSR